MIERKTEIRMVGPEQRQGHVAEDLARVGAVDRGRLLELLGDLLQPRQVEDHVEAEVLPRDDDEDRVQDEARVGQPVVGDRVQPGRAYSAWSARPCGWSISDHTTAATTSESTNGAKKRTRSSARALQALVEDPRDPQREGQLHGEREHDDDPVVLEGAPEDVVVEGALEVVQADEVGRRGEPVPLVAAVVEGLEDRRHHEQAVEREGGRRKSAIATHLRARREPPRPRGGRAGRARPGACRPGPRPARPGGWGAPPGLPEPMPSA